MGHVCPRTTRATSFRITLRRSASRTLLAALVALRGLACDAPGRSTLLASLVASARQLAARVETRGAGWAPTSHSRCNPAHQLPVGSEGGPARAPEPEGRRSGGLTSPQATDPRRRPATHGGEGSSDEARPSAGPTAQRRAARITRGAGGAGGGA